MTTKANLEYKDIVELIYRSDLTMEDKATLHDWYTKEHERIAEEAMVRLDKVRNWREGKIRKLQNKVHRRLK